MLGDRRRRGRASCRRSSSARSAEASESIGLSEFFIGVIVVAIVGNAAEHWVAVLVAHKDKMDLAVNIAIGSSAQVALFVAPVLVLASFLIGPGPMPLVFNGFELGAVLLAVADRQRGHSRGRVDLVRGRTAAGGLRDPCWRSRSSPREAERCDGSASLLAGQLRRHPRRRAASSPTRSSGPGNRLAIGEGAVGSLLAAVGTAMPETLIPIVAIIGGGEGAEDVAIGAIIGAPFLLATIAMALVGISALVFTQRREPGHAPRRPTCRRSTATCVFFLVFFAGGVCSGSACRTRLHIPLAVVFVLAYAVYVRARPCGAAARCRRPSRSAASTWTAMPGDEPAGRLIVLQFAVGLGGDRRRRPPVRRGADRRRRGDRRRAARPLADPRPARHRAAGEGQQLLLGARGQGQPRAREHHRRDGLPVDDPGRLRPRPHRLGPRPLRDRSRRRSASPAARRLLGATAAGPLRAAPAIVGWAALYAVFLVYVALS